MPSRSSTKLVGIVIEADLIHRSEAGTERQYSWWLDMLSGDRAMAADYVKSHARKIAYIMTREVKSAEPETPLVDIAELFERHHIKRVPIVNKAGDLVGIASRANIIQAVASARPKLEITLSDATIRQKLIEESESSRGHTSTNSMSVRPLGGFCLTQLGSRIAT